MKKTDKPLGAHTRLLQSGRTNFGTSSDLVNPPIERASTILFERAEDLYSGKTRRHYGRIGTASQEALRAAIADLEGAADVVLTPSGLAACTMALLAVCTTSGRSKNPAHVLIADCVYGPTRAFCNDILGKQNGLEIEYFDPRIGAQIADKVRPETCAIFLESPGSLTFEISDLPVIAKVAQAHNIPTLIDNTWGAGWFLKPLALGIDYSIEAATKYHTGHSDVIMGAIAARDAKSAARINNYNRLTGMTVSPDDAYLVLRGMRTMGVRLDRQQQSALKIAKWLSARDEVVQVLHPALPEHPDHAIWKRDFDGAAGLFGVIFKPTSPQKINAFLDNLALFGLGFSWGGYESLAIPCDPQITRTAKPWDAPGPLVRFNIGLEDVDDLIGDIEQALAVLA